MNPVGEWLTTAPWRDRAVSLLLITHDDVTQAATLGDKQALAQRDGRIVVLWTGKWWTEARIADDQEGPTAHQPQRLTQRRGQGDEPCASPLGISSRFSQHPHQSSDNA